MYISKIIFQLTCLSVWISETVMSRHITYLNGHSSFVVYQGPDKVILLNLNVVLFRRPGDIESTRAVGTF